MDLSTENIIDLVLAAFFLCMIARGWYMGLVFITFVLFLQVVKIVKIVDWIPVVGTLDRAGGAVAGFFFAFLACFFLFRFLYMAVPQEVWDGWGLTQAAVGRTYLLQAFLR